MKYIISITLLSFLGISMLYAQNDNGNGCNSQEDIDKIECDRRSYVRSFIKGESKQDVIKDLFNDNLNYEFNKVEKCENLSETIGAQIYVNFNGKATKVTLIKRSGCKFLDKEIIRILRKAPFVPAECEGNPVCSFMFIHFKTKDIIDLN